MIGGCITSAIAFRRSLLIGAFKQYKRCQSSPNVCSIIEGAVCIDSIVPNGSLLSRKRLLYILYYCIIL